jgi:glycosyltransferase involved in cell wall biosynthesis
VADAVIDIVGHFGSRLSYATVTDQVVRGLLACDKLGRITNLDDKFIDDALAARSHPGRGKKVLLLADARDWLVEAMAAEYGRENVAIFLCPNTNQLSDERQRACHQVDRIYTPSRWCSNTILDTVFRQERFGMVHVQPLGVDSPFSTSNSQGKAHNDPSRLSMLHVTTDTFWPGRKGTEELLKAWKLAEMDRIARLTIHCLPQLYGTLHQELGDLDLIDKVKLISAPARGCTPEDLFELVGKHDLLVAPSRSEGFGIMPLSALVSGTPVLTTAGTGQNEYLAETDGEGEPVLGGWLQIPTFGDDKLEGEDGSAPCIRPDQLAFSLVAGRRLYDDLLRGAQKNQKVQANWSWFERRNEWVKSLVEWEEAT